MPGSYPSRSGTSRARRGPRERRAKRAPGCGRASGWIALRAQRRRAQTRRGRGKIAVTSVVRLLFGSRLACLETPEGGTRSSSHRAAELPTRLCRVATELAVVVATLVEWPPARILVT